LDIVVDEDVAVAACIKKVLIYSTRVFDNVVHFCVSDVARLASADARCGL
jgi:hypothetical protein